MTHRAEATPFNPLAPLPRHTTVLEAGAGTGKTYTIAAQATALLARGEVSIGRIMVVTFARSASYELRSRLHERVRDTAEILRDAARGHLRTAIDPVDMALCQGTPDQLSQRARRLDDALADFDRATIATEHEFCARLLDQLGILVDHDRLAVFMDDPDLLRRQVLDDCYLSWLTTDHAMPPLEGARQISRLALAHPDLPLLPVPAQADPAEQLRIDFAEQLRRTFEERKRHGDLYDYDDMVQRVVRALSDPLTGDQAARVLAQRYDLVMVDEFQDTSPFQWQILERAFHGRTRLVVIGDPRQSIYAFRGADLQAYLNATQRADAYFTLTQNYRSDAAVVDGLSALFGKCSLGTEESPIVLGEVHAAHTQPRIDYPIKRDAAVQLRAVEPQSQLSAGAARAAIIADLVGEFGRLLANADVLRSKTDEPHRDHLQPSDMAVLVRRRAMGEQVQRALIRAGIPAVFTGAQGVFESIAARDWLTLLQTLADPRPGELLRLASSRLIGWSPSQLADSDEDQRAELAVSVKSLQITMREHGVAAVFEELSARYELTPRLLTEPDGERVLTDLRHLCERLNAAERRHRYDLAALTAWLAQKIEQARESSDDDAVRRLETDRRAVSIMTIHKAKGLQFPVVALPDLADRYSRDRNDNPWEGSLLHVDGRLCVDLFTAMSAERRDIARAEGQAEDLRLLYVAATRAQSRLIAWWANTRMNTSTSPLHRIINADKAVAQPPALNYPGGRDPERWPVDRRLIDVVTVPKPSGSAAPAPATRDPGPLSARDFHDHIDREWTRTSYSGLTAGLHDSSGLGSAFDPRDDEPELTLDPDRSTPECAVPALELSNPLSELPGGTQFGSLVHSVLEIIDPASARLDTELLEASSRMLRRWPVAEVPATAVAAGLSTVVRASLGSLTDGRSLAQLGAVNRLAELEFEMPLGQGSARRTVADLAALWKDPGLMPSEDPLSAYGPVLAESAAAPRVLAGFLTGSIDAVLRLGRADHIIGQNSPGSQNQARTADSGQSRFCLIDYKTNRIPTRPGERLGPHSYTRQAMTRAMIEAHYPLQALIYSVALHRYLDASLPGYDPEHHLAGVGYLFVRGMTDQPVSDNPPPGVFIWHPTTALVLAASAVMAGKRCP